jgi:putative DNA primase/helicase
LKNVSHEALQDLGMNRFRSAELFGKLANGYADLEKKAVKHTGIFKMLTSGDYISAEKKMQQPFQFRPFAKLVYSANELPEFEDKTYAIWRRMIIFSFENVFEENKDLISKLTTQEELSGLLNLALIGLRQLIKDNGFAYIDDIKTITKEYTLTANSVSKFLENKCEVTGSQKDYIICRELWSVYFNFCKSNGLHCKDDNMFGRELPESVVKRRIRVNKEREYCYCGIRLKPEETKSDNSS